MVKEALQRRNLLDEVLRLQAAGEEEWVCL